MSSTKSRISPHFAHMSHSHSSQDLSPDVIPQSGQSLSLPPPAPMFVYPTCFTLPFYTLFMSRLLNSTTRAGRMGESQSSGATRSRRKGSRRISGTRCACARDSMSARALTRAAITSNAQSSARVRGPRGRCPQYPQCQGSQSEIKHTDTAPTLALCLCVLWYIYIYVYEAWRCLERAS